MARRSLAIAIAAGALALPASPASAATCAGADSAITALNLAAARDAVLCIVNAERTVRGLNALTHSGLLETAAQLHTDDMVARGYFDHITPEGVNPGERITAAGYRWSTYGENIAAGFDTPRAVMLGWMKSSGHCRNVLDPGFTQLGVGISLLAATLPRSTGTWTQNFGRPLGTAAPGTNTAPRDGCPYSALQGVDAAPAPSGGGDTPSGGGETPSDGTDTPSGGETTGRPARMVVRLQRFGRRLTITGTLTNSTATRARLVVRRNGRTIARRTARVRRGKYRFSLRLPSSSAAYTVRVSAGKLAVKRPIRR